MFAAFRFECLNTKGETQVGLGESGQETRKGEKMVELGSHVEETRWRESIKMSTRKDGTSSVLCINLYA